MSTDSHTAACATCQDFDKPGERFQEAAYRADCDCNVCAYSKKHPQLNAPRCHQLGKAHGTASDESGKSTPSNRSQGERPCANSPVAVDAAFTAARETVAEKERDAIVALLDGALALHQQRVAFAELCKSLPFYHLVHSHDHVVTLFEERSPGSERILRRWAESQGLLIEERMHHMPEYQQRFRVLTVRGVVSWQGPSEWPAPVVVESPRTERDEPCMWRPSDSTP